MIKMIPLLLLGAAALGASGIAGWALGRKEDIEVAPKQRFDAALDSTATEQAETTQEIKTVTSITDSPYAKVLNETDARSYQILITKQTPELTAEPAMTQTTPTTVTTPSAMGDLLPYAALGLGAYLLIKD